MTPIFAFITGPEIAVLVGLAVLLFGADRIPKLARSMGEAKKEFEKAQRGDAPSGSAPSPGAGAQSSATPTPPSATTPPTAP